MYIVKESKTLDRFSKQARMFDKTLSTKSSAEIEKLVSVLVLTILWFTLSLVLANS